MIGNRSERPMAWRSLLITLGVVGVLALALFGLISVSVAAPPSPVVRDPDPQRPLRLTGPAAPLGKSTLGDYVWYDQDVDGDHTTNPVEFEYTAGIDGVRVNLYLDADKDTQIDAGEFVTFTTTGPKPGVLGSSGWYTFSVTAEGNWYIVEIDPSNFAIGGPLENHVHTSIGTYGTSKDTHLAVMPDIPIFDYAVADFGYALSELEITKELISAPDRWVVVSDTVTYRITIRNTGWVTITKVPLYDHYNPACLRFLSALPPETSVDKALGTIYWADLTTVFGPLPAGGAFTVDVTFHAQKTDEMYWKEGSKPDYAPKGMPDFDQKQDLWDNPPGSGLDWYACGPVATANSLWWFDSKFEPNPVPPPHTGLPGAAINDTYALVPAYGGWDDHDPNNVQPLVNTLAGLMGTAPAGGTTVNGLVTGIQQHLSNQGLANDYTVTLVPKPEFEWIEEEVQRSEDVILLLGFWQESERIGGHYVTVAGVNSITPTIGFSDPYRDNAEAGGAGRILPAPHGAPHGGTVHNDAKYASQDVYAFTPTFTPGGIWGPEGYVDPNPLIGCVQIEDFIGQNVGDFSNTSGCNPSGPPLSVEVEYAIAVSPLEATMMCDPTNNIAVVSGAVDELDNEVPEVQSEHETHVVDPSIEVVKVANDAPDGQVDYIEAPSETVYYTFTITNTGDTYLYPVTVTDDVYGSICTVPPANGGLPLAPGAWFTCTKSALVAANVTNTVTVVGTPSDAAGNRLPPNVPDVLDSDDAKVLVVDARLTLTPLAATNEVGDTHTITVTVEQNDGWGWSDAADGTIVTFSAPGATFVGGNTCSTVNGECTVTINSATPQSLTISASANVNVQDRTLYRQTGVSSGSSADAVKVYQNARILLEPLAATNEVSDTHTVTVTVEVDDGSGAGWTAATDGTQVDFSVTGSATFVGNSFCTTTGGKCTVAITDAVAETLTINATTDVTATVGGPVMTRTTGVSSGSSADAEKIYVDARILLEPLAATNEVSDTHTVTVTVEVNDGSGAGWTAAPDGTQVNFGVTGSATFVGNSFCTTTGGKCTVTITDAVAETLTISATTDVAVGGLTLTRTTNVSSGSSADAEKIYVDARILLEPLSATNEVTDTHTVTVTVEVNDGSGAGWTAAPDGTQVNFGVTGSATFVGNSFCTTTGGKCTVTITDAVAETLTISATTDVAVGGLTLTRTTNVSSGSSADAEKIYVDARILLEPLAATNEVTDTHTVTVTVEVNDGSGAGWTAAPDGTQVNFGVTGSATFVGNSFCTTTGGKCTVTITDAVAETLTISATTDVAVGGLTLTRTTNVSSGSSTDAEKIYVDARILLEPLAATNEVGDTHTVTVTVEVNDGSGAGWTAAPDGTQVDFSVTGSATFVGNSFCTTTGGKCTVAITDAVAETLTISATTDVAVGGLTLTRTTNVSSGSSADAEKIYVDARILLEPLAATNEVGDTHTVTVTVEVNDGSGAGWTAATDGTQVDFSVSGSATFVGNSFCTTTGGKCTVAITDAVAETLTISATTDVAVGGLTLTRTTNVSSGSSTDAEKIYVDARILLEPLAATNEVTDTHTVTVTVEVNDGSGAGWTAAPDGTQVDFSVTGSATFVGNSFCTTTGGKCTVAITDAVAETLTISATTDVAVGGLTLTRTTNVSSGSSTDAEKIYVDARIILNPLSAVNQINDPHVITATVEINDGSGAGWTAAPDGTQVNFGVTGSATFVGNSFCTTTGGLCTVTINDAVAETVTISATTDVAVGGLTLTRTTNVSSGSSTDAEKDYVRPEIVVDKTPDLQYVLSGSTVFFTIYVTNTGDVPLLGVTATDPLAPNCAGPVIPFLGVGASTNYQCSVANVTVGFTNVITVTGTPGDSGGNPLPGIPDVSDSDDAEVRVYDLDFGDLPGPYPTLLANNGPRHVIGDVRMGQTADAEPDGQPSLYANGDDNNNLDDEDGVVFLGSTPVAGDWTNLYRSDKYIGGWTGGVVITITADASAVGKTVYLHGWFDFNHDGDLEDPGENVFSSVPIQITAPGSLVYGPPGAPGVDVVVPQLQFPIPLGVPTSPFGDVYSRFRLEEQGLNEFEGLAQNGEVEDYWLELGQGSLDFGDAPDPTYPTYVASNGARHIIGNIWMGAQVDAEADGQPVNQDDVVTLDDEDGVTFLGWKKSAGVYQMPFIAGQTGAVRIVVSGGSGYLHGWIDWNQDGDWDDPGENVFSGLFRNAGTHTIEFPVPSAAQGTVAGTTWARFRLDDDNLNSTVGLSDNGEVEDYPDVPVVLPGQIGDFVWWDVDYNGRQDAGEPGIPGVLVNLYNGTGAKIQTDTTDGSGLYLFDDLLPDTYRIQIDPSEFQVGGTLYQWNASPQNAGGVPDDLDSDGNAVSHDIFTTLTAGEVDTTNDFGFDKVSDYEISKTLNTTSTIFVGYPLSFTIRVTNIGNTWIGILPLRDVYSTTYLSYGYQDPNTSVWTYADPASDDTNDDGVINWSDLTLSFGQDLAPGASFTVVVTFTAKEDTGLLLPDGKTEDLAIVEGAYADADGPGPLGPDEPLPTKQDPERVPIETATGVTLAGFAAAVQPEGVLVSWETASELDILGFNVLRSQDGGEFELVNVEFIFAQVAGTGNGAAYEFLDGGLLPGVYSYTLEVMHLDGRMERYGLIEVIVGQ